MKDINQLAVTLGLDYDASKRSSWEGITLCLIRYTDQEIEELQEKVTSLKEQRDKLKSDIEL